MRVGTPCVSAAALLRVHDPSLPVSPDGFNLTRDTVTGLEWLHLTLSLGRSLDDLIGNDGTDEFAPGGDRETAGPSQTRVRGPGGCGPGAGVGVSVPTNARIERDAACLRPA